MRLGQRVALLKPDVHVFGHTHIPFDGELPSIRALEEGAGAEGKEGEGEGDWKTSSSTLPTRFVQAFLGYPAERRRSREGRVGSPRSYELQLIWDCGGDSGGESESDGEEEEEGEEDEDDESGGGGKPAVVVVQRRGKPGPKREAFWTSYYEENARDPANLELAPWVRPRVERYKNL